MSSGSFDFGLQAMAEFWGQAGRVAMQAQEEAGRVFADALKAMPGQDAGTPAELALASKAMTELWNAASGMSGTLLSALKAAGASPDPTVEATFRAMADPRSWLTGMGGLDSALGRMADGARLADLWNAERQQARVMRAWLEVRRRGLEHNTVVLKAWMRAGEAFSSGLPGRDHPDGRAMLAMWTETANRVLLDTQRSPAFLQTQAAMIRAGTELRMAQRDLAEHWAGHFDMPTRTEVDDVHRTLTELRREVRALRREARARPPAPPARPRKGGKI